MKADAVSALNVSPRFQARVWRVRWLIFAIVLIGLIAWPIQSRISRVAILAMIVFATIKVLWLVSRTRIAFSIAVALCILLIGLAFSPMRPVDEVRLRENYLAALREFEGTTYVWGGEGRLGIDCSGLIRTARRNALMRTAVVTANPGLGRMAFSIWWNDCTARQLGDGFRGWTQPVCSGDSINTMPLDDLYPGDLAIVANGKHVLAYLGDQSWIEANPDKGRVTIDPAPDLANRWLCSPTQIVRWRHCSSE